MIIAIILDESGSMNTIMDSTISGFNEFVDERKNDMKTTGKDLKRFIKITFNSTVDVHEYNNIDDIPLLTHDNYHPTNATALYDAIGKGFTSIGDNKEDEIWFIIITDGLENRSNTYNIDNIKEYMKKYKEYNNWNFIFCGANQDSYLTSKNIGMDCDDTVMNFEPTHVSVGELYRGISRQVSSGSMKHIPVVTPPASIEHPPPVSSQRPRLVRVTTSESL